MVPEAGELMGAFGLGVFCANEVEKKIKSSVMCPAETHLCLGMRKGGRGEGGGLREMRSCVPQRCAGLRSRVCAEPALENPDIYLTRKLALVGKSLPLGPG